MMTDTKMNQRFAAVRPTFASAVLGGALALFATQAGAATVSQINEAVNVLTSDTITGGFPTVIDYSGPTNSTGPVPVVPGVELPSFAFGTYDVDVTGNSLKMTFVNDIENLLVTQYDDTIVDQYFFEFDRVINSAVISSFTPGFAAGVSVIAPGTVATAGDGLGLGLPTSYTFEKGGIFLSIGAGTDLNRVAAANGSLTIDLTPVPLPASLPLMAVGLGGLIVLRRRKSSN